MEKLNELFFKRSPVPVNQRLADRQRSCAQRVVAGRLVQEGDGEGKRVTRGHVFRNAIRKVHYPPFSLLEHTGCRSSPGMFFSRDRTGKPALRLGKTWHRPRFARRGAERRRRARR